MLVDAAVPSPVPSPALATPDAAALARRVHWALRLGAAACFVGHGAFGVVTKAEWVPYFAVVGIPRDWAFALMPAVGAVDVAAGIAVLLSPRPAVLLYMAAWALWTALLRPLSGAHAWEAVERAGNYGVPLALLLLATGRDSLGLRARAWLAPLAARPAPALLAFVAAWKLATEALFLAAGAPVWELVERGGSYAAPVALALLLAFARVHSRVHGRAERSEGVARGPRRGSFAAWTPPARAARSRSSSPSRSR